MLSPPNTHIHGILCVSAEGLMAAHWGQRKQLFVWVCVCGCVQARVVGC